MTRRQRYIILILAVADLAIILALVALMTHLARSTALSLPTPSPCIETLTTSSLPGPASATCQWQAAQQMVQAGLSGSVTLIPGDTLHFEIAAALAPGQTTDDAAQLVWMAFDVALALPDECAFTQVEVTIRVQDSATTLHAGVAVADLAAYSTGALTEDEFIARVTYTVDSRLN